MTWRQCLSLLMVGCLSGPLPIRAENAGLPQIDPDRVAQRVVPPAVSTEWPEKFDAPPAGGERRQAVRSEESDAALVFSASPTIGLFAGFRFPEEDVMRRNAQMDREFDGPYVGALIRF